MAKYRVVMRNPRTGEDEAYISGDISREGLDASLELFREGGYEIISANEISGEDKLT